MQYRAPRPRQQKMNDVYAVVNKSKQLPPPASSTAPLAGLHHYDNEELGVPKCHVGALYSMVKPKSRCLPAKPPPAVSPIYDTAGLANHRLAEASAGEDQSGYELVAGERISGQCLETNVRPAMVLFVSSVPCTKYCNLDLVTNTFRFLESNNSLTAMLNCLCGKCLTGSSRLLFF